MMKRPEKTCGECVWWRRDGGVFGYCEAPWGEDMNTGHLLHEDNEPHLCEKYQLPTSQAPICPDCKGEGHQDGLPCYRCDGQG